MEERWEYAMGMYGRGSGDGKGVGIEGRVRKGERVEMQERMGREEGVKIEERVGKVRMDWKWLHGEVERARKDGERIER